MPSLWVDEITSIGMVKSGDDPEAKVMLWKAKPEQTSMAETREKVDRALRRADRYLEQQKREKMTTKEDILKDRDRWVEKHRKDGESDYEARLRFWKENPDHIDASRSATSARPKQPEKTIGEITSAAIDKKARSWHLEGRFIDVNLPTLRGRIRKSVPGLTDLERSTEPASRFEKSKSEATQFVAEWS